MDHNDVNYGVQQSGGVSHVGVQAVGPGARARAGDVHMNTAPPAGRAALDDLIGALRQLLEEHGGELADPAGVRATADILREEIDRPEPDPGVVRRMLGRLAGAVQPVAALSAAVAQIAEAVKAVLGG